MSLHLTTVFGELNTRFAHYHRLGFQPRRHKHPKFEITYCISSTVYNRSSKFGAPAYLGINEDLTVSRAEMGRHNKYPLVRNNNAELYRFDNRSTRTPATTGIHMMWFWWLW